MASIMILIRPLHVTKIAALFFLVLLAEHSAKGNDLMTHSALDVQKEVEAITKSQGVTLSQAELMMITTRVAQLEKDLQTYIQRDHNNAANKEDSSAATYLISTAGVLIFLVLVYFLAERLGLIDYLSDRIQSKRIVNTVGGFIRDVRDAVNN
jgi:hypothetical protein